MTNPKPLSELQLKAIALLSQGLGEAEVAANLGKSRSWVQSVKRHRNYQKIRDSTKNAVSEVAVEQIKQFVVEDLQLFRERYKSAADLLFQTSEIYLSKVKQRAELLDLEDISPSKLGQSILSAGNALNLALQIEQAAIGLEQLVAEVESFAKINSEGSE